LTKSLRGDFFVIKAELLIEKLQLFERQKSQSSIQMISILSKSLYKNLVNFILILQLKISEKIKNINPYPF
jgi:hypothetical protein